MVRNCCTVAGLPLTQARLLPCRSTVRRNSRVAAVSKPASSSNAFSTGMLSNSADTSVRVAPSRITLVSARAPVTSCKASIKIDFPAPVSPVSTVKPCNRSSSNSLTITKSRKTMRFKLTFRLLLHSNAFFAAKYQNKTTLAGAKNTLCAATASPQYGPLATKMPLTAYQN